MGCVMPLIVELDDEVASRLHAESDRLGIPFDVPGNQILWKLLSELAEKDERL